jgi:hypothetical protein
LRPGTTDVTNCPSRARIQHSYAFILSYRIHQIRFSMTLVQSSFHGQSTDVISSAIPFYHI